MHTQSITSTPLSGKHCKICNLSKPVSEFGKDNYRRVCRGCRNAAQRIDRSARTCPCCGEAKPYESFQFMGRRRTVYPRQGWCRDCRSSAPMCICSKCGKEKTRSDFRVSSKSPDGHYPKCIECQTAIIWKAQIRRQYGIEPEDFARMLEEQGSSCKICGSTDPGGDARFRIDHDHDTGLVRGLLCHSCNTALGHFKDSPELLEKAAAYLRRSFPPSTESRDSVGI